MIRRRVCRTNAACRLHRYPAALYRPTPQTLTSQRQRQRQNALREKPLRGPAGSYFSPAFAAVRLLPLFLPRMKGEEAGPARDTGPGPQPDRCNKKRNSCDFLHRIPLYLDHTAHISCIRIRERTPTHTQERQTMTKQQIAQTLRDRIADTIAADDPAMDAAQAIADALEEQAVLLARNEPYATTSITALTNAADRVRSLIFLLEEADEEQERSA